MQLGLSFILSMQDLYMHFINRYIEDYVFRVVMQCSSETARRFGGTYVSELHDVTTKKTYFSVTTVRTSNTTHSMHRYVYIHEHHTYLDIQLHNQLQTHERGGQPI
jgi:hypothetical protein